MTRTCRPALPDGELFLRSVVVQAELPDHNGMATEQIKQANIVSFTCLKGLRTMSGTNVRTLRTLSIALRM